MVRARLHLWLRFAGICIAVCGGYLALNHWVGNRLAQAIDRAARPFVHADGHAIVAPSGSVVLLDGRVIANLTQIAGARLGETRPDSLMLFLGAFNDSAAAARVRSDSNLVGILSAVTDWSRPVRIELIHRARPTSRRAWARVFIDSARVVIPVYLPDTSDGPPGESNTRHSVVGARVGVASTPSADS